MISNIKNWLEKNKKIATTFAVVLILATMFGLAFFSSRGIFGDPGDSGTMDEVAHVPASYTYINDLDYRLNPEHPPLVKALSGVFMHFNSHIVGPEKSPSWDDVGQWEAGWYMLYGSGGDPKTILDLARLPVMLLMIFLGFFLFRFASKLYGRKIGLIVLVLYAFYPDVIAHGRLVTTDVAAALGFVLAVYFFDQALRKRTWKSIIIAGLMLGIAELCKFSAILLLPIFFVLIIIKALIDRNNITNFNERFGQNFKTFLWTTIFSLVVVWLVYIPFTWNTPPAIEHKVIEMNLAIDSPILNKYKNFLHKFENNRLTRPIGHYLVGVSQVVGRVEGGNNTYIMGYSSDKSISWFFPAAWLLKTPISIILLAIFAVIMLFVRRKKTPDDWWKISLFSVPLIIYWAVTLQGSLNLGIRHLMPTVPFVLLMIGYALAPIVNAKKNVLAKSIIAALLAFLIYSTVTNFPHYISYFNELTAKDKRYTRMIDSSLDWGQDFLRLKQYIEDNNIQDIRIDYFGGSSVSYYLPKAQTWHAYSGPTTGWLAISATYYQSSKLTGKIENKPSYAWLDNFEPEAIIGDSILVFNISSEDLRQKNLTPLNIVSQ